MVLSQVKRFLSAQPSAGADYPVFFGRTYMKKTLLAGVALSLGLAFSGAAFAQIKLGVAGPITGPNAAFGKQLTDGAAQAVDDINAAGGILGQKLEVVAGDDVSDPKQGISVANKMVADGVKHLVGHFNSGVTIPASDIYAENGVLMITPSATNPKLTEDAATKGYWNVFRTCGRDDQQGAVAAAYLLNEMKGKKVAVVHDKTPYGQGLADETKKAYNAGGGTEVVYEGVNTGDKDFSALVTKIKSSGAEIVYFGGLHTEAGLIARQLKDQGVNAPIMSGDGITSDEFATIGGDAVIGTLMTFPPDPRKRPEAAEVLARMKAANRVTEAYALYSYAAVEIMKQAAEEAKSADGEAMSKVMKSGKVFKTVIGDISYNAKGDITRPDYVMYTWKKEGDKITYVQN
jgi:branched-chain amino acid transport system substrate-binding protein